MFNIKNPNTFLGGQNVHNLLILGALGFIIYNQLTLAKKLHVAEVTSGFSNAKGDDPKEMDSYFGKGKKKTSEAIVTYN